MVLKKWTKNWDDRIINWHYDPIHEINNSIENKFYKGSGKKSFVTNALPEPYIGNPLSCSCVIINLNPGPVIKELQDIRTGRYTKIWERKKSYFEFAKSFPYLMEDKNNGGFNFWNNRRKWINRLLEFEHKKSQLNPFALEIVPYHSEKFGQLIYDNEFLSHLENELIIPAEEATNNADLPFVISVGKPFLTVFQKLGFQKLIEFDKINHPANLNWPYNKKNEKSSRYFSIWESKNGKFFYNTWSIGSNKMPSEAWGEVENCILKTVKTLAEK